MSDRLLLGADEVLVVAACERRAASFACRRWHYSATMPAGKLVTFGVWERGEFVGAVVFGLADADQGHHGGIYQAMNWTYTGAMRSWTLEISGVRLHPRTANRRFGTCSADLLVERGVDAVRIDLPPKHRYALGLDRRMRRRLTEVALPYPRPAVEVSDGETPAVHAGGTGSIPVDRSR